MKRFAAIGLVLMAWACAPQADETSYQPAPPPPSNDPAWDKVVVIIQADCAGCHNGTKEPLLTPASAFKASKAKQELQDGTMPPAPHTITPQDKATLLVYLGG